MTGLPTPSVPQRNAGWLRTLAGAALIVGILYFASEVLIPLALALLLTFLLAPAVIRLRRWGLGRVPAVIVTAVLAFSVIGAIGYVVAGQLMQLAADLPSYQQNISKKLRALRTPGDGLVERTSRVLEELETEMNEPVEEEPASRAGRTQGRRAREPMPVVVQPPRASALETIAAVVGPLINPLATAGVVVVLVIFMLIQREDLRDRFIGLLGTQRLNVTTQALDDAGSRISRYLLMQLLVNVTYGLPVGIGLHVIGVPNALLWGVLATVLRFVPYLGPLIGMSLPLLLAFAVDPGWQMVLMAAALFLLLELVSNNVVEPWLYGSSTGISSVAIMVAAIFWTWLWGPIGLLLSTPLTVCIAVAGRYVPQLSFLSMLLGSEPALEPHMRLYQRMLALDFEEASELAGELLASMPLRQVYDELVVPALSLAETDRHEGHLDEERKRYILDNTRELAGELAELALQPRENGAEPPPRPAVRTAPVVCLPAQDESDEVAAIMLRELLRAERGLLVDVRPAAADLDAHAAAIRRLAPAIVIVSSVPPAAVRHAVHACKRLKTELPEVRVVVGLWSSHADAARLRVRIPDALAERLFTRLSEAADWMGSELGTAPQTEGMTPAPVAPDEPARLAALERTGLLDTPPEAVFDRITRRLSEIFDAPISLMSLIDEKRQFWKSQYGLPAALAGSRAAPRETSMCGHVVAAGESLVVEDTLQDERFAGNPFVREHDIRFYAGAPLRAEDGSAIGSLCVIDHRPRRITERERQLLELMAEAVMAEVQRRSRDRQQEQPQPPASRNGEDDARDDQAKAAQALLAPPVRQSIGHAVITHRWSGDGLPTGFLVTREREDGSLALLLGDAGPGGASGPLLAAAISSAAGRLLDRSASAGELLTSLNRMIGAPEGGVPVSATAAVLTAGTGQIEVATAGYTPPVLIRQHAIEPVATTVQPPLFGDAGWEYSAGASWRLEPGDRLLFYTERAVDVPGPEDSLIGVEGLAALAVEHDQDDADAWLISIDQRLTDLAGAPGGWWLLALDFARGAAADAQTDPTAAESDRTTVQPALEPVYPAARSE
ncbi:MAG TPA: AI-2E family transporter [Vicinamibacterales bacterium]